MKGKSKNMNYKHILFDFDGTISDSAPYVMSCFEAALRAMGKTPPGRDELICYVGPPLADTFTQVFGFEGTALQEIIRLFRAAYAEVKPNKRDVFTGVPEMLDALKKAGKCLGIATSKREFFARESCKKYEIDHYFDTIAGSSDDDSRNQKDEIILYALEQMGVTNKSDVLMVGDRLYDVEGASNCGIDALGVLYGYGSREELQNAGAKYIAETAADVMKIILST